MNLPELYLKDTGNDWINSQGEPDIDYIKWLEDKLMGYFIQDPIKFIKQHIKEI